MADAAHFIVRQIDFKQPLIQIPFLSFSIIAGMMICFLVWLIDYLLLKKFVKNLKNKRY